MNELTMVDGKVHLGLCLVSGYLCLKEESISCACHVVLLWWNISSLSAASYFWHSTMSQPSNTKVVSCLRFRYPYTGSWCFNIQSFTAFQGCPVQGCLHDLILHSQLSIRETAYVAMAFAVFCMPNCTESLVSPGWAMGVMDLRKRLPQTLQDTRMQNNWTAERRNDRWP